LTVRGRKSTKKKRRKSAKDKSVYESARDEDSSVFYSERTESKTEIQNTTAPPNLSPEPKIAPPKVPEIPLEIEAPSKEAITMEEKKEEEQPEGPFPSFLVERVSKSPKKEALKECSHNLESQVKEESSEDSQSEKAVVPLSPSIKRTAKGVKNLKKRL
jgi:hypothetical protein